MPSTTVDEVSTDSRLLLISNRLPTTVKRDDATGEYKFSVSSGGLVAGLSGLSQSTDFQWYGWPGLDVPLDEQEGLADKLSKESTRVIPRPVFLDNELIDAYYNGFSSTGAHTPYSAHK